MIQLNNILSEQVIYDEIAVLNTRLQTDCQVRAATYLNSCRLGGVLSYLENAA